MIPAPCFFPRMKTTALVKIRYVVVASFVALAMSQAQAQTHVRPVPGGKVLAFIDGNDLRAAAGGKRMLFVDGENIRPEPGGKRLLFLDGSHVRPEPGGTRLAFWDGPTLRRGPGGKILLVVDGADIRPEAGGKRLYFLDGPAPSRAQLTAALLHIQPDLFKLTKAEEAAAKTAISEGEAWTRAQSKPENENGKYAQMTASGPLKAHGGCTLKWSTNHYDITFENGGLAGLGFKMEDSGWHVVGGIGKGDITVGIFAYKDGTYSGSWFAQPGAKATADKWTTAAPATGDFASKIGKLTLTDTGDNLAGNGKLHTVASDKGKKGVAYKCGNDAVGHFLVVVVGGEQPAVFDFKTDGGMLVGDYFGGPGLTGYFTLNK
jgi:hypothetical protein